MADETTKLAIRDEIPLLGTRKNANLGSPIIARQLANELRVAAKKGAARAGEDAHDYGTKLAILYKSLAERHFERARFLDFVRLDLEIPRTTFYDWIRVARYATATQARWGVETCLAAARLIDFLAKNPAKARALGLRRKAETISDLSGVDFPLPDGRTLRFEGDTIFADDVEDALTLLEGGVGSRTGLSNAQRAGNEKLREAIGTIPVLKGVEAKLARRKGKNVLHLVIPSGGNPVEIAKAITKVLAE